MKRVLALALLVLLAFPGSSRGDDEAPALRKHVLSAGIGGVALGGLGARYTYRAGERGPTLAAGAGYAGYGLELGLPVHRAGSQWRELFVYVGVLRWRDVGSFSFRSANKNEEGSHTWVIGVGPRLWPSRDSRVYVAGGGELMLSNENFDRGFGLTLSVEGGVGF